jgi:nucleoside-diphosphate-sugar epimerase
VLVTGSSGLLGSRICADLARDHEVVGFDLHPPEVPGPSTPSLFLECDLTDDDSVHQRLEVLRERRHDRLASVVHLAAYYDFSGEPSPLYDQLTVGGTRRLLRGLQDFRVEQFMFSSSLLVMRAAEEGEVLTESSPVQAEWDYPQSKLEAEQAIRQERGAIPAVILRVAGVYDEDGHSVPIGQQLARIYERQFESHFFPGDLDHGQSFVHVDDVVSCVRAVVEHRDRLGEHELFLVGERDVLSYGELQDELGKALHGKEWTTIRIPAPLAKAGAWLKGKAPGADPFIKPWMIDLADAHLPVSPERARERLGWEPRHSLRSTLPEMAHRMLADPAAWYRENGIEPPDDLDERAARTARQAAGRG